MIDGRAFRFVGANVAVMYSDEERARMPETLRQAAADGVRVVRVWASGEGGTTSGIHSIGTDAEDWPRAHPFRFAPNEWNEEEFEHLDSVLAEASRNHLRVQLCLANWWRDTGGVMQYLAWAGITDAAAARFPYGIDAERAAAFYTNAETRRLYREHVARIVSRRNSVTKVLYRDDPTILGYELMNEAQCPTGRDKERRAWLAEMSAYVKSLDSYHLITPGTWSYRTAFERRAWLADHSLPTIDYCDVHNYPRDDSDVYVDSPAALQTFIDNRAAAAFSIDKPLVLGEFGMAPEGYNNFSQADWYKAYFAAAARACVSGAMFWILTPDPKRGYGIAYATTRDEAVRREIKQAAANFASLHNAEPTSQLLYAGRHLIPHQFAFTRALDDPATRPAIDIIRNDGHTILYRFNPQAATRARFEKIGGGMSGSNYIWGAGAGFIEYTVPARDSLRSVGEILVRAHLQPVVPRDAENRIDSTRVTLFINDTNCGSRLIHIEDTKHALTQEWRVDSLLSRAQAALGKPLSIRFSVEVNADQPFGLNISGYSEDSVTRGVAPVEVEIK